MHTIFLNTAETMSSEFYRKLFFESQLAEKQLMIADDCVPLERLKDAAGDLALRINQEADIMEDICLVVYIENPPMVFMDRDGADVMRASMIAVETIQYLKAEATLVNELCRRGKYPKALHFIFGERTVKRDDTVVEGVESEIVKQYWSHVALPSCDSLKRFIAANEDLRPDILLQYLKENAGADRIITPEDGCYDPILQLMADNLAGRLKDNRHDDDPNWDMTLDSHIYNSLSEAIDDYEKGMFHGFFKDNHYPEIEHWYLPIEDRDPQEKNRTECRLMTFVYALTHTGNGDGLFDFAVKQDEHGKPRNSDIKFAKLVPDIEYDILIKYLKEKLSKCLYSGYKAGKPPEDINEKLKRRGEEGEYLIDAPTDIPELVPKLDIDESMNTASLRKAVHDTLTAIRQKSRDNQKDIRKFINRAKAQYDRTKDDAFEKIVVSEKLLDIVNGTVDENGLIDNLQNIEDQFEEIMTQAEANVLSSPGRLTTTENIDDRISTVRKQTDYYFNSLKIGTLLLVMGVVFVLAFLIPYISTRKDLFSSLMGIVLFVVTACLIIGSLLVGYLYFSRKYKKKIIVEMRKLIADFTDSQRKNKECLQKYIDFMYRVVPRCYGLHSYGRLLRDYKNNVVTRKQKITFHEESKKERRLEIRRLLDNLDADSRHINDNIPRPEKLAFTIDPEADRIDEVNRSAYVMLPDEIKNILIVEGE